MNISYTINKINIRVLQQCDALYHCINCIISIGDTQAFIIPLEVHNYALKPKTREDQDQIEQILERRKVEIAEKKVRGERAKEQKLWLYCTVHTYSCSPL